MSRADKRRRKLKAHWTAARGGVGPDDLPGGLPAFAPTPERLRRGEISVQPLIAAAPEQAAERDWTGERRAGGRRKVVMGHVRRDLASAASHRLSRFSGLTPQQLAAAVRLERDWEMAGLEPRMTVDLHALGIGGRGGAAEVRDAVLAARDRLQAARTMLRRGGEEVLRVVEGVVIHEATADTVGAPVYAGRRDASVYVRSLLGVGLNLLAAWRADEGGAR